MDLLKAFHAIAIVDMHPGQRGPGVLKIVLATLHSTVALEFRYWSPGTRPAPQQQGCRVPRLAALFRAAMSSDEGITTVGVDIEAPLCFLAE